MNYLDTGTLSLLMGGNPLVTARANQTDELAITIVTRIEILQGRFASILKAKDGHRLVQAQEWLHRNEEYMNGLTIVPIDDRASAEFDRLRQNRKLKKIGRADLLIPSIALAHNAILITRNLRHFRQVPGLNVENWAD